MSCTSTVNLRGFRIKPSATGTSQVKHTEAGSVRFYNYTVVNECSVEGCDHIPDHPDELTVDFELGSVSYLEIQGGKPVYVEAEPVDGHFAYDGPVSNIQDCIDETATPKTERGWKKTYFDMVPEDGDQDDQLQEGDWEENETVRNKYDVSHGQSGVNLY